MATAPMASEAALSDVGVQVTPPSTVIQTPPREAPTYRMRGSVGCCTISVTRPLTITRAPPYVWPLGMAVGPSSIQLLAPGVAGVRVVSFIGGRDRLTSMAAVRSMARFVVGSDPNTRS